MEHIIAYNPYKNGNKGSVSSQPLSVYDKTIAYPWMAELVAAIRGGNDELKKQLPFRCAHYYQFRDNRRSQKNAVPESFLFQTTIDVDDKEYVDKAIEKARELNCSDTIWNGALLHLEYSARKKLHIDIRMPIGMTIEETAGNYPDDTQGCILVGENKFVGMVVNSRIWLQRLINAMTAARDRDESIWITIL